MKPTAEAKIPDIANAEPINRFERTPSKRAVLKSVAAARSCRPKVVLSTR